ncbi:dihydrofolate reductase [Kytococcus sedentarius]|uniref:Dihydrofolate reductase n=2 Tax=Kytococcus sedentarius TaxID=1276 RepID=C7NL56_KYTSD|nr:dihydrofolate reductase [Kytococcus sedentarius DSM 20547]QQB65046.1 dihydrofolate reductase [Kytococcus sedentarius]STX12988.1 Pyrimidine deaminase [Kytococcus sedentarius]
MTHQRRNWTGRVFIGASLDGFIARRDGEIDWLTDPPPGPQHATVTSSTEVAGWDTFFPSIDHLVMGRGTYEKVLTFDGWPYGGKKVIVMSTTLESDDDRITIARSLDNAQRTLAASGARQVYVDGGMVVQEFLRADLIDEISIGWAPVLIGSGRPLFGHLDHDLQLSLVATNASASGMVHVTYAVHPHQAQTDGGK